MKKQSLIAAVLAIALLGASAPNTAMAQTYTTQFQQQAGVVQFQPRTLQEQVAFLYGLIAQLQFQLALLQGRGVVRGIDFDDDRRFVRSRYDIEIDTQSARDIEDDEATLRGSVDMDGAPYVRVWFEYGQDGDLDEDTRVLRIENRGDDTRSFSRVVDDLEEDEVYFFRAVGEGPDGSRDFGSIRSFRTDDDFGDDDDDDDFDEPDIETGDADDIDEDSATLEGEVKLNDADFGRVFFIFGTDEDEVEDATDEDEYADIDRDGDELNKTGLTGIWTDNRVDFEMRIRGLDDDTRYFYVACVEYEDDDDDEQLECGDIEGFRTDD